MNDSIIKLEHYTKIIKKNTILNDITLELKSGKIYAFVGHNGSGKSMLFKAICGFIKPTSGKVKVRNKVISKDICFPEKIGILIETVGLLPNLTAFENLKILASIQNEITDNDIKDTLSMVGLDPENKKPIKKYSLGMKQKVGIAQAIMEKPEIIILDEPMNGLDLESVNNIRNIILDLKAKGNTILLASHNESDIDILADEIFQLNNGVLRRK